MEAAKGELRLEINPRSLSAMIDVAVVATSDVVNFHLHWLAQANLDEPAPVEGALFRFNGPKLDADQRRALHESWIVGRAFQELLRAVRQALEEAYVITTLLNKRHRVKSNSTIAEFVKPFQRKAAGMRFPELLDAVNQRLDPKLNFAKSYESLQIARNCLEHRAGIVSAIDTHGKKQFDLQFPRMKMFYVRNGEEVELARGERIDPGDKRMEVDIFWKLEVRRKSVAVGERLIFSPAEFNEIAFACHFLGNELAGKLPNPQMTEGP